MKTLSYLIICAMIFSTSCKTPTPKDLSKENLIPKPLSLEATGSSFNVNSKTGIIISDDSDELKMVAEYFAQTIRPATGFDLKVEHKDQEPANNFCFSVSDSYPELGKEGYRLTITSSIVTLDATCPEGIFRGIQTIRQLFPPEIERDTKQEIVWELASGTITDQPDYEYRGAMLDVCRHFFTVDEVKQYIDWLARYKMNTLHLHLTDDQGWRIEIKKWPKLTTHGGSTEVGGGKGGFYTQEEYKEIVQYASDRFISIVPEIDMPGHTNAALASYAELNCNNKATELYTGIEVGFSTLCTRKEVVYEFIEDVVKEMVELTPGPYFHIGGDESHSTKKEDYIYFLDRVKEIVYAHGKQLIGWDDITVTNLKPNTVTQFWHSKENSLNAVKQGLQIIMSPADKAYLDIKYDSTTTIGLDWAGLTEVDNAYEWDMDTLVPGLEKKDILGIECPLWTETVTNMEEMEYLVFPRLLGYAEIGWTPKEARDWNEYKERLANQAPRFKEMGLNFYASKLVDWKEHKSIGKE